VFGAGDMTVAHKTGEHVAEADLHRCVACLTAAASRRLRSTRETALRPRPALP
jgi:hypothetical protein